MNIGKYIRLLRRGKQLNWQRGQLLSHDLDLRGSTKIVGLPEKVVFGHFSETMYTWT